MTANDIYKTVAISGTFTARSPISHIGESLSTTSYLVQDPIVQPNGTVENVFSYSGNAWRGQLRDLMARRVAEAVGTPLPADSFHLLFSGGRLDMQDRNVDLAAARRIRAAVPMVSLLGGGIGSEILSGRLHVFSAYPVCREAMPVLPAHLHDDAEVIPYASLTYEKEFSRKDDAKSVHLREYLEGGGQAPKAPKAVADQMRMTSELVAPGTRLHTEIRGNYVSRVEMGCLVQALADFGSSPVIGGQSNKGHGLVDLAYEVRLDGGEAGPLVNVSMGGGAILSPLAAELAREYLGHLVANIADVRQVLKVAA